MDGRTNRLALELWAWVLLAACTLLAALVLPVARQARWLREARGRRERQQEWVRKNPADAGGWEQLAQAYISEGRFADAVDAAQRATVLARDNPLTWGAYTSSAFLLAKTSQGRGRQEALGHLAQASQGLLGVSVPEPDSTVMARSLLECIMYTTEMGMLREARALDSVAVGIASDPSQSEDPMLKGAGQTYLQELSRLQDLITKPRTSDQASSGHTQ